MLTLVYGYGVSGKSAVNCLVKLGRQVAIYADKHIKVGDGLINRTGLPINEVLEDVGLIVISPSVDLECDLLYEARKRNIGIILFPRPHETPHPIFYFQANGLASNY